MSIPKPLLSLMLKLKKKSPVEMADYAGKQTRFYRRFYQNADLSNFEDLPVLTKYDLIGVSPYDMLSRQFEKKVNMYGETSGSSGSPTPGFMTKTDFKGLIALSMLSPYTPLIRQTLKKNRTAVNGLTFGFTIAGFSFGALMQQYGALVAQLGSRSTIAVPERTAETIVKLKPSIIAATPLDFMSWMEIIRADYPKAYPEVAAGIKVLLSAAEPCAHSRTRQIEEHFNLTHINVYASVDGFLSLPCPCGDMHLIDDLHYVELFDNNMKKIGKTGTGRLCFTNLLRRTTPMVRFLLDDLVTVKKSLCPYGFQYSITPRGRYELSLELNNQVAGNQTFGNLDFENLIYAYGLFMDYRVEVSEDAVHLTLEAYSTSDLKTDLFSLINAVQERTGMECRVKMLPMGRLTNFRDVRSAKSIIKVIDRRKESRQKMPQVL